MHPPRNSHTHPSEPETTLDLGGLSAESEAGDAQADTLPMSALLPTCQVWKEMGNIKHWDLCTTPATHRGHTPTSSRQQLFPFPVSASWISALNQTLQSNRHKLFPEVSLQIVLDCGHGEKIEVWVQLCKVQVKAPSYQLPLQGECNWKRVNGNSGQNPLSFHVLFPKPGYSTAWIIRFQP